MNPGLVIKLRPSGPWRIGPDSGARNRVDAIYHSDSLYSAVTSAMLRLGSLEDWLDATARQSAPAVSFSSCFPFLDEIGFVIPPRTIWPPTAPGLLSARVRWKSARFVPLGIVQAILAGQRLEAEHWSVDGASECLVPAGRPGPFRTGVRWNAAVDRLTGAAERHSTACLEFRPGAGLWTIASFADDAARERWLEPVKAAFRLLADSGFGGERSRGWGRSEAPEFIEGALPDMIVPPPAPKTEEPAPVVEEVAVVAPPAIDPLTMEISVAPSEPEPVAAAEPVEEPAVSATSEAGFQPPIPEPEPEVAATEPSEEQVVPPTPKPQAAATEPVEEPVIAAAPEAEPQPPAPNPQPPVSQSPSDSAHWLLSLYTPAADDSVDWQRGSYSVVTRSGRVDSPTASGDLKKQLQMVAEGSVLYAAGEPHGSALDVAPDGFAHPVFRAGFAVSIPLPEVS